MRVRLVTTVVGIVCVTAMAACGRLLGREYEYEEDVTLSVDGSAVIDVNASIPALVALRGMALDANTRARFDDAFVANVRRQAEAMGCTVQRVSNSAWYRDGRRFIQIRLDVPDVANASSCGLLGWSKYTFGEDGGVLVYKQSVGAPAGRDPGKVNWKGSELVAFKVHVPSKIKFHNVKNLETGQNGQAERGNILTWEQRLSDRRAGVPVDIEMRMDHESILRRTLLLFAGALVAALLVMGSAIWWTIRRPRSA